MKHIKKKKSLGKTLLAGLIVFTLLLACFVCLVAGQLIERQTIEKYAYVGSSLTEALAGLINGDRAVGYLQTREKDDSYYRTERIIISLKERFEAKAIYVAVPEGSRIVFIWSDEVGGGETLGYSEEFTDGGNWIATEMLGEGNDPLWFVTDPVYGRLAIAASPVLGSNGKPVAIVFADFSMQEIDDSIRRLVSNVAIIVLLLMAVYAAVFYWYTSRNVIQPIRTLTGAAESMADNLEGDAVYHSEIHTGNELETLSESFEKMNLDLRRYISDNLRISAEQQRVEAELDLAASIQSSQLPQVFPPFPDRHDFEIHASMTPAKTVGGDFYDFYLLDDRHLAMVIADVSGKGIPASLFMMISRMMIKNRLTAGQSPSQAISDVNRQLMENNQTGQFVTVWVAVVDLATGKGVAVNAGHEHPALRRRDGQYELVLYKHSLPVAVLDPMKFPEHEFQLSPGDSLFVYTDGVTEATDRREELFGTDRMLDALNQDPGASCAETLEHVMNGIRGFLDGAEQFDDITMLCFRYLGS